MFKSSYRRSQASERRVLRPASSLAASIVVIVLGACGQPADGEQTRTLHQGQSAQSLSGTTIPPAAVIVDADGSTWSVTGGVINKDGASAGYSANVTLLLYYDGTILQENAAGGWWSWNGGGWTDATDPRTESPDGTTIPPATTIADSQHHAWTVSNGVVYEDGLPAGYTANVSLLLYLNHTIYQENAAGGWWSWSGGAWKDASDPRSGGGGASGGFVVAVDAGFTDPNGNHWAMRGLNAGVQDALDGFGNLFDPYPGLTAIRLNCDPANDSSAAIAQVVSEYTGRGVVVEVEDHSGVGDNVGWYQQMAQTFKDNPRVFLETPNEPTDPNTAVNQIAIVQAIRNAGFTNPIGLQPIGGYDFSNIATVTNAVSTTQMFLTPHIYDSSSDPNGPANYVSADLQTSKTLGLFPVIDEFGDALDGWHRDPYGPQVITSVIDAYASGQAGALFWAMDNGNHPDGADSAFLVRDGTQLTSVGLSLQPWLQ